MYQTTALLCLLGLMAAPRDAQGSPPEVTVNSERVSLGDIVADLPAEVATLDLGPAPAPGASRLLARREMRRRLRAALLDPRQVPLPPRVRIRRPGQRLTQPRLRALAREAVAQRLPAGAEIRRVAVGGGLIVPLGPVRIELPARVTFRAGRQALRVRLRAGQGAPVPFVLTLELTLPESRAAPIIERGARVRLRLTQPELLVECEGRAQEAGSLGDRVAVMPRSGRRLIHGVVRSADLIEVIP